MRVGHEGLPRLPNARPDAFGRDALGRDAQAVAEARPEGHVTAAGAADDGSLAALIGGLVELGEGLAFNRHLGVEVAAIEPGRCETVLPADERLRNHVGGVHAIAELAPVELAGALAASTRLSGLLLRGYVPVVGALSVRYRAPAVGRLVARAEVGEEVVAPALAAADAGERPRVEVAVQVTGPDGTVVADAEVRFVYLAIGDDRPD
jgi:acyl-coenzyme A thioesterase PaaI-like protein